MDSVDAYDYLYKIVLIGDSGTGKTNLLSRYISQNFFENSKTTIGVEFSVKTIAYDNIKIKAQIWDTAGQERYRAITSAYYRAAIGAMIVFDITKKETFLNVEKWILEIKHHCNNSPQILLVGNKSDLKHLREVSASEIKEYAEKHNLNYVETSAKEDSNVEYAFEKLVIDIYNTNKKNSLEKDDEPLFTPGIIKIDPPSISPSTDDKCNC